MMVQHVLRVLCRDSEVRSVLSCSCHSKQRSPDSTIETESLALTQHAERFGSLPSIRLIPGTFRLLECLPVDELFDPV
jgi:hypothetical protein